MQFSQKAFISITRGYGDASPYNFDHIQFAEFHLFKHLAVAKYSRKKTLRFASPSNHHEPSFFPRASSP
jgi:hypothetical protein